jgi:glycerophosphoryl diester phosphodiesterase
MSASVCQRVGHGGASALVRQNTLRSFDAAVALGVDMIEFDVRRGEQRLVLAHTSLDARRGGSVALVDALEHLRGRHFAHVELNVDVKQAGCESELIGALRDAALLHRTLISSQVSGALDRVRAIEPEARLGISVGGRLARASRHWRDWRSQVLAGIAAGRWDALMAQHRLIDGALLDDVRRSGGYLYAWTVNDRRLIRSLGDLGVHGIVTADPRLFA